MQHQLELSAEKCVDRSERMRLVFLVPFDPEAVIVAHIHGEDVIGHVWHTVPHHKVHGKPVPGIEERQIVPFSG